MILRKVGFLLFLTLAASAALGSSETAFETFKGFEGKWAIRSGQKTLPIEMTYEIGSKGSIVTEQFGKELSVFYRDGQSLLMTHFCNAGNQPRLRLREDTSKARTPSPKKHRNMQTAAAWRCTHKTQNITVETSGSDEICSSRL